MLLLSHPLSLVSLVVRVTRIGYYKVSQIPLVVRTGILWQAGVPEASLLAPIWWMRFSVFVYADRGGLKAIPKSG